MNGIVRETACKRREEGRTRRGGSCTRVHWRGGSSDVDTRDRYVGSDERRDARATALCIRSSWDPSPSAPIRGAPRADLLAWLYARDHMMPRSQPQEATRQLPHTLRGPRVSPRTRVRLT